MLATSDEDEGVPDDPDALSLKAYKRLVADPRTQTHPPKSFFEAVALAIERKYDEGSDDEGGTEVQSPQPAAPREWLKRRRDDVCSDCGEGWVDCVCFELGGV